MTRHKDILQVRKEQLKGKNKQMLGMGIGLIILFNMGMIFGITSPFNIVSEFGIVKYFNNFVNYVPFINAEDGNIYYFKFSDSPHLLSDLFLNYNRYEGKRVLFVGIIDISSSYCEPQYGCVRIIEITHIEIVNENQVLNIPKLFLIGMHLVNMMFIIGILFIVYYTLTKLEFHIIFRLRNKWMKKDKYLLLNVLIILMNLFFKIIDIIITKRNVTSGKASEANMLVLPLLSNDFFLVYFAFIPIIGLCLACIYANYDKNLNLLRFIAFCASVWLIVQLFTVINNFIIIGIT